MRIALAGCGGVMRYVWLLWIVAGTGLVWSLASMQGGLTGIQLALAAGLLLVGYWLSPWFGGISRRHRDVEALPESDRPCVIYWRPADIFSTRLRGGMGKRRKDAIWINVWQDPEAADFAQDAGKGMLPVVVLRGRTLVNPDPREVLSAL